MIQLNDDRGRARFEYTQGSEDKRGEKLFDAENKSTMQMINTSIINPVVMQIIVVRRASIKWALSFLLHTVENRYY